MSPDPACLFGHDVSEGGNRSPVTAGLSSRSRGVQCSVRNGKERGEMESSQILSNWLEWAGGVAQCTQQHKV